MNSLRCYYINLIDKIPIKIIRKKSFVLLSPFPGLRTFNRKKVGQLSSQLLLTYYINIPLP